MNYIRNSGRKLEGGGRCVVCWGKDESGFKGGRELKWEGSRAA